MGAGRILILGGYGMLGHRLWRRCRQDFDTWATVRRLRSDIPAGGRTVIAGVEASQPDTLRRAFAEADPQFVVNCIGVIKQREAAADPRESVQVNALFPHQVAALCRQRGAKLIHLSTDCVFSGRQGYRSEADTPNATDLYGRSKMLGEAGYGDCLTIRTSMIGRELGTKYGLAEWFLSQAGSKVNGFTNAFFSGLTTGALADAIVKIIRAHSDLNGVWHVAGPRISKYDLLCLLRDAFQTDTQIVPEPSLCIDRSLDGRRFERRTGWVSPSWRQMVADLAREQDTGAAQA